MRPLLDSMTDRLTPFVELTRHLKTSHPLHSALNMLLCVQAERQSPEGTNILTQPTTSQTLTHLLEVHSPTNPPASQPAHGSPDSSCHTIMNRANFQAPFLLPADSKMSDLMCMYMYMYI